MVPPQVICYEFRREADMEQGNNEYSDDVQNAQTEQIPKAVQPNGVIAEAPKMLLAAQEPVAPDIHVQDTAAHAPGLSPAPPKSRKSRRGHLPWWIAGVAGIVVAVVLLGFLLMGLYTFTTARGHSFPFLQTSQQTQSTSAATPTIHPMPTAPASVAAVAHMAVMPGHLSASSDCQFANGYRCAVVIVASRLAPGRMTWSAASKTLTATITPTSGSLWAYQQQQISIFITKSCPYQGSIEFTTSEGKMAVPVICSKAS
jgi:hypothetical protein